jgi:tetratricopeptide (TPR) repeat protein
MTYDDSSPPPGPDPAAHGPWADGARDRPYAGTIQFLERSIRADWILALGRSLPRRAQLYAAQGDDGPWRALGSFNRGLGLGAAGRIEEAEAAYLEAHALDDFFLWPLNNLAWLLATTPEAWARDGARAVKYAEAACAASKWNCWAFLGTLAAAHGEAGDFAVAVSWQRRAMSLAPGDRLVDLAGQLADYESARAYVDEGDAAAPGSAPLLIGGGAEGRDEGAADPGTESEAWHRGLEGVRRLMPEVRLLGAIRAVCAANGRTGRSVTAVKLMNRELDDGKQLDEIFHGSLPFTVSARRTSDDEFDLFLGCFFPNDRVGDGGEWRVVFCGEDVASVEGGGTLIS